MNRRAGLSLVPTKNLSKARSFHISPFDSLRTSCESGKPCKCIKCSEAARKPICEICRTHPTTNQSSQPDFSGESSPGNFHWWYTFTSFCDLCWGKHLDQKREREIERRKNTELYREKRLALRKEKMDWILENTGRLDKMMESVRILGCSEQVPIACVVDKLMNLEMSSNKAMFHVSRRWFQSIVLDKLSQDLQIVKVRNRFQCNKRRVDAMDFKLWWDCQLLDDFPS